MINIISNNENPTIRSRSLSVLRNITHIQFMCAHCIQLIMCQVRNIFTKRAYRHGQSALTFIRVHIAHDKANRS